MPASSRSTWRRLVRNKVCSAGGRRVRRGNRRHTGALAAVESLEDRVLLSAGDLDPSFGGDGRVLSDFGQSSSDYGRGVAFQSDGKIILAGASNGDFAVARYNTDGSLDTSFGTNGRVTIDFGGTVDAGYSVAVDSDDRVLVAGESNQGGTTGYDVAVARLTAGGVLDTSFNGDGKVTIDFGDTIDFGNSVAVDSAGRVLVGGSSNQGGTTGDDFAVARLTTTGDLDTDFDDDGKQTIDFAGRNNFGDSMTVDSEDRVLLGGTSDQGGTTDNDFAVARLTTDGVLDTSFNIDGKVTIDFGSTLDLGTYVTVDSADRVLVGGYSHQGGYDFAVARLTMDGALDTNFGGDGKQTIDFGSTYEASYSVTVDSEERVLIVGESDQDGTTGLDFAVARLTTNGALDATFGTNGMQTIDFGGGFDTSYSVIVDSYDRVLVAGYSYQGTTTSNDFAMVRLLDSNAPPIADAGGPYIVDEGDSIPLDGTGSSDPNQEAATLIYEWDLDYDGAFDVDETGAAPPVSFPGDFATRTIALRVTDDQGESDIATTTLTVNNVAPSVTADEPIVAVDEGATASMTGVWSDPGDDVVTLAASAGAVVKNDNGTWSWSFNTSDGPDETQTVTITATDSDGGESTTTFGLTVNNVDPTATIANDGPVDEGSPATVSLTGGTDPSSADAASLHYFFSTDEAARDAADYAGSGTTSSDSFTFDEDGSYTVYARILDDDGGFTDYETVVTVDNVNPTATIGDTGPVNESVPVTVSLTGGTDPSIADTTAGLHYFFSTDEAARDAATYATAGTTTSDSFTFNDDGSYTIYARVIDDDGGFTDYETTITVKAGVGLVMAPRSGYPPIVTVYNTTAQNVRFSFYAYQSTYRGGVKIATGDVNGDGVLDIITAPGGDNVGADIRVYSGVDGTMLHRFFAFAPTFHGGFNVAAGDVDGDGFDDIIVSVDSGWKSAVIAFDGQTTQRIGGFFAYGDYRGGVNIATGDVNGDGVVEILTVPGGTGVYAHVRAFAIDGQIVSQFVAFPAQFSAGTFNIAAGDVTGDGIDDVIVSVGSVMLPWVRVFNGATPQLLTSILAYPSIYHGGVSIGTGDVNLDGRAEVLTSIASGALSYLGAFDGESGALIAVPPTPYGDFRGGTYIAGNLYDTEFLTLDGEVIANSNAASLEVTQVKGLLAAAAGKFRAAGFAQTVVEQIAQSDIRVTDLAGDRLAMTQPGAIVFDVNAAGWGWFIDETPNLDEAFAHDENGMYRAIDVSAAQGKVDLLSVLTHEIAHELGFDDLAPTVHGNSLLTATLPPGARRATREQFDDLFEDAELMDELLAV